MQPSGHMHFCIFLSSIPPALLPQYFWHGRKFFPGIPESNNQYGNKNQHFPKCKKSQTLKPNCPGKEENRFHIEGEYLYKQYSDNAFKDVQAVNTYINYDLPLRKVFNKMSFLLRYDMMTDQSDAKTTDEETGALVTTDYKRQRLTGGITFSLSKAFRTDLRLNYEKYFYANSSIAKESEQDKIVLELMVRF